MEIGMSLPTMAERYDRSTTLAWCRGIDAGPFSSVSCGERITYHNQEMLVTMSAAAVRTERGRVFCNLVVGPLHATAVVAKQLATLDVLAGGRLTVGVGIGGREHDILAAERSPERRHARLDALVAGMREVWKGAPPFKGAGPVGPSPVQPGGPPVLSGAMGPKATRRAAAWADGISGFSLGGVPAEIDAAFRLAERTWDEAGRTERPRLVTGCFFALDDDDAAATEVLRRFAFDYLRIFGDDLATAMVESLDVSSPARVREVLDGAEAAGCDEFILVPATTDVGCLQRAADVVARR
jgi:alkanesulfonate monooxygenase SsuD/methylene tetrahydromethanopterin reductase-like flavin-dependent oxidoreductase (luciferase family)